MKPLGSKAGEAPNGRRCQDWGLKPLEARKRVDRLALGAPGIDRRSLVGVAERDAAEEDVFGRDLQEGREGLVPVGPGFLRAGVEAVGARQQHDVLQEAADVGPLRRPHGAVDRDEQPDRRIVEEIIARKLAIATGAVLARNGDRRVELIADARAAAVIRLLQFARVDVVFGALPPRKLLGEARTQLALERLKPLARN